jgi:Protein of unknown function (DUF1800)/PA14 domain/Bacterial TSP3 repeat
MNNCSRKTTGIVLRFCTVILALAVCERVHAQKLDQNSNGMSDVWEQIYNAVAMDPNLDSDGDGVSNLQESIAGTNPFDANSVPKIPSMASSSSNFSVTLPAALGKQYQLQSVQPNISGWTNWTVETTTIARTGTVVTLTAPIGSTPKFFRVGVTDVDTDGDGLNDWEEYQLGLDPTKEFSNNQLDPLGQPMNDRDYAIARMASQNVVTISATDPTCVQPDVGQIAGDLGQFTVSRGGFPLNAITVNLAMGGPGTGYATAGVDHLALPTTVSFPAGVGSTTVSVRPLPHASLLTPVVAQLKILPGTGYTIGSSSNASIIIYPTQTPSGTGLTGAYYTNASATYSSPLNFAAANLKMTRLDTTVDFTWGTTSLPFPNNGYYCVRWTGQVQPQYSEKYFFVANTDDGVKVWVNDVLVIDSWVSKTASDLTGSITLQAGVRYNIKMEYFQLTGSAVAHLSWYSASQPKQVIPASRLYPSTAAQAPTVLISPRTAVAFINQPFNFSVVGANSAALYSASPLPPGLNFNTGSGLITGNPTLSGDFQVFLTASNSVGVSASVLTISVFDTGSSVVREVWTNAPGVNIADIPLGTTPSSIAALGSLEGITDFGDNYGERIRGYITAPATANYYFWIAGSDSAELWISNDSESCNKVRRAYVSGGGTASRQWTVQPNQKSGWLSLVAGQKYYIEVLHKAGVGAGDNWSVGYLQDPTGTNNTPVGLVPAYLHSVYYAPPASVAPGTLYVATMLPGIGVTNMPVGSATLRLSADNSKAVLNFSIEGISSTIISEHINNDPYLGSPSGIMFDISDTLPQADGSFIWNIGPVGTLSAADVIQLLKEGKGYITILTDFYPNGELIGHFEQAIGSSSFTPPPPPPAWTDDHTDASAASRFLIQTTFGPSPSDVANVQAVGYTTWIDSQFALPATHHLPLLYAKKSADPTLPYSGNTVFNTWWQQSITAPDQLRQRVAFALSEIMVVSDQGILMDNGVVLSSYYDTLLDNAFGNYRDLLEAVSLHPAMGLYLNMQGNDKGNIITGAHANENYAREIKQLFSIGLNRMWPDGTLVMNSQGEIVPTYDQNVIMGFAAMFTGWNYWQPNQGNGRLPTSFSPGANYTNPMVLVPTHHDLNTKLLLDNVVVPAAQGSFADSTSTNYDLYGLRDLELAHDSIFYNQNVGPFICRQLIQRLVTSHPSPAYLYRVVQTFNDNGSGVRGDLQAVIKAILLDYEARSGASLSNPTFGKEREPLLRVTAMARAFPAPPPITGNYSQPTNQTIYFNTDTPHRLTNSETALISFTDTSGVTVPPSQGYSITVQSPTRFTIAAPGMVNGTYTQVTNTAISNALTATIDTTNVIFVNIGSHGAVLGQNVYLRFVNNGIPDGIYRIVSATNGNNFAVETADTSATNGACVMPRFSNSGTGFTISRATNCTVFTPLPHGLNPGDSVHINFSTSPPADGQYQVVTVPTPTNFTIVVPNTGNGSQNGQTVFPLIPPPLLRSGSISLQYGTFSINESDNGNTYSLAQTPLNAPTVFNFFFPDYKYPGALSTAGLTTPEFQLTSDTTVMFQMNFLGAGILGIQNNANNTNGLSSFGRGDNNALTSGTLVMDISPYMTQAYTTSGGLPGLVDALNSLLCGGQLSAAAKTQIVNYTSNVSNFPYGTPPTIGQIRDRVRAVVHLITSSPDYTVQR